MRKKWISMVEKHIIGLKNNRKLMKWVICKRFQYVYLINHMNLLILIFRITWRSGRNYCFCFNFPFRVFSHKSDSEWKLETGHFTMKHNLKIDIFRSIFQKHNSVLGTKRYDVCGEMQAILIKTKNSIFANRYTIKESYYSKLKNWVIMQNF